MSDAVLGNETSNSPKLWRFTGYFFSGKCIRSNWVCYQGLHLPTWEVEFDKYKYLTSGVEMATAAVVTRTTSAILFHQSSRRHRRHLPTLCHELALLRPSSSSTTYPHGGTLPPRHFSFHFPTTSRPPQALQRPATVPPTSPAPRHLVFHFSTTSGLP